MAVSQRTAAGSALRRPPSDDGPPSFEYPKSFTPKALAGASRPDDCTVEEIHLPVGTERDKAKELPRRVQELAAQLEKEVAKSAREKFQQLAVEILNEDLDRSGEASNQVFTPIEAFGSPEHSPTNEVGQPRRARFTRMGAAAQLQRGNTQSSFMSSSSRLSVIRMDRAHSISSKSVFMTGMKAEEVQKNLNAFVLAQAVGAAPRATTRTLAPMPPRIQTMQVLRESINSDESHDSFTQTASQARITPVASDRPQGVSDVRNLRFLRDMALTKSRVDCGGDSDGLRRMTSRNFYNFPVISSVLRLCGMGSSGTPVARLIQGCFLLIALAVFIYRVMELFHTRVEIYRLSDVILSLCSVGCVISSYHLRRSPLFDSDHSLLLKYAIQIGFDSTWRQLSRKHLAGSLLIWLVVVTLHVILGGVGTWQGVAGASLSRREQPPTALEVAAFAFNVATFTTATFLLLHYLNAFLLSVDGFVMSVVADLPDLDMVDEAAPPHDLDLDVHITAWEHLRAILKLGSSALWRTFIVPALTSVLTMMLCSADILLYDEDRYGDGEQKMLGGTLPVFLPVMFMGCLMGYVLLRAAAVTSACERLPILLSSFRIPDEAQQDRLIKKIEYSAAGFYVEDVLITTTAALKILYFATLIFLTVLTKAVGMRH